MNKNKEIAKMLGWVYILESKCSNEYTDGFHMEWSVDEVWVKNPTEKYLNDPCHYGTKLYYGHGTKNSELFEEYKYELNFDKDWNLLMEAVNFIEHQNHFTIVRIKNEISLSGHKCTVLNVRTNEVFESFSKSKIEAVFESVYEYAKKYNELKNYDTKRIY